jgi:hypothetical protein
MIFTIIISNQVGFKFTRSLYQRATRAKQMPIISDKIPGPCKGLKAGDIMAQDVISLQVVDTVENIRDAIRTSHHAFPILNNQGKMVGIIPRNFVLVILANEGFYNIYPMERDDDRGTSVHSEIDAFQNTNAMLH